MLFKPVHLYRHIERQCAPGSQGIGDYASGLIDNAAGAA
jgi:hypothetical protein